MCQARRTTITVSRTAPATAKISPPIRCFQALEDRANLQADEDEREDVQREHDRLPHGIRRYAGPCGDSLRRRPRDRDGVAHHRQHAGEPELLGEDPHAERADELENDGGRHVLHTIHHPQMRATRAPGPTTTLPATASRKVGATAAMEKPLAATAPTARR